MGKNRQCCARGNEELREELDWVKRQMVVFAKFMRHPQLGWDMKKLLDELEKEKGN